MKDGTVQVACDGDSRAGLCAGDTPRQGSPRAENFLVCQPCPCTLPCIAGTLHFQEGTAGQMFMPLYPPEGPDYVLELI